MKITKIGGISHKKYEEKGKLIKSNEIEKDVIEERFSNIEAKTTELFSKNQCFKDFFLKYFLNYLKNSFYILFIYIFSIF